MGYNEREQFSLIIFRTYSINFTVTILYIKRNTLSAFLDVDALIASSRFRKKLKILIKPFVSLNPIAGSQWQRF
jgi:hypothetical protein